MMAVVKKVGVEVEGFKGEKMKLDNVDLKPKKAVIKFKDTPVYFLNSLRRIMISELPKLSVNDVVIYDNTSALFDEIISHRLGLVPIPTDLSLLSFRDECVCKGKGCPNCTVRYTLSKEGEGMVYSGDLQPAEKSWAIKEDKIPIVELFGDQRLILEVEAVLGRARDHAKWQGVTAPGYRFGVDISFDKKHSEDVKKFVGKLPKDMATIKGDKIVLKNLTDLPVFESYLERQKIDYIDVVRDSKDITFTFETDGSFSAKDALLETAKMLQAKYSEFGKQLTKLK